jgi:hypothetical protein
MNRNAATLMEALVAIFVMAIGLLTLLTLFPLGAISMAQAIQDDRAAGAAANAIAMATARNLRQDPVVQGYPDDYFKHPPWAPPLRKGSSYPLYVDPFGVSLKSQTVGDQMPGIPRRTVSWIKDLHNMQAKNKAMMQWFTLLDDMKFLDKGKNKGQPTKDPLNDTVDRGGRYSWAYLLRRPNAADPAVVDATVVIYAGRLFQLPLKEAVYRPVVFDPDSTLVKVMWDSTAQEKPPIRKGGWILDASMPPDSASEPHGYFYRVVGVVDVGSNCVHLELEKKPQRFTDKGVLIVMENVIEVFEKGSGWQP